MKQIGIRKGAVDALVKAPSSAQKMVIAGARGVKFNVRTSGTFNGVTVDFTEADAVSSGSKPARTASFRIRYSDDLVICMDKTRSGPLATEFRDATAAFATFLEGIGYSIYHQILGANITLKHIETTEDAFFRISRDMPAIAAAFDTMCKEMVKAMANRVEHGAAETEQGGKDDEDHSS